MSSNHLGMSGLAVAVPPYRVNLQDWCAWTGNSWDKTRAVVGESFRMCGPQHSVYTMAANAVLGLILRYEIDPRRVGFLALGTESSTDNAAGAVIVRGLVDRALVEHGQEPLARDCEVPELKQACLAGVYGVKGALRYLAYDGSERQAIVVAADIAEYERGSTGEVTQGAGAVATLLEQNPRLLALDLRRAGSASSYRVNDFRKPFSRFCGQAPTHDGRPRDYPVFNGKYSTACYIDETLHALESMFAKRGGARAAYFRDVAAVFLHRPYQKMPVTAWALGYLFALGADGGAAHEELAGYAASVGVDFKALLLEMKSTPDLSIGAANGAPTDEAYPLSARVVKALREAPAHRHVVDDKMKLGSAAMRGMGNLYSAAMLAWLAAGLEEAHEQGLRLDGKDVLLMGYGSGDAAEAIPGRLIPGWEAMAARIGMADIVARAVDLSKAQYEALHDGHEGVELPSAARSGFVVDRVGKRKDSQLEDLGVEYHRYVRP